MSDDELIQRDVELGWRMSEADERIRRARSLCERYVRQDDQWTCWEEAATALLDARDYLFAAVDERDELRKRVAEFEGRGNCLSSAPTCRKCTDLQERVAVLEKANKEYTERWILEEGADSGSRRRGREEVQVFGLPYDQREGWR